MIFPPFVAKALRAIGWVLLAVLCGVVIDLAIAGLFVGPEAPCPCDLCVRQR